MASLINAGKSCSVITYDWWDKYDRSKCTREEEVKLCLIEVNEMYREGLEESPLTDAEYDFLMSCVDDADFKKEIGTGLGAEFVPQYKKDGK